MKKIIFAFAASLGISPQAMADETSGFPLIFEDIESQRSIGVLNHRHGPVAGIGEPVEPLPNRCFYYGMNGDLISLSDAFVAPYVEEGFSLRTLCLGMISGISHHPETGDALATALAVEVRSGAISSMGGSLVTLEVPDCFKRGAPLTDCRLAFDFFTGEPLSEGRIADYRKLGEATFEFFKEGWDRGYYAQPCGAPGDNCYIETYAGGPSEISEALAADPDYNREFDDDVTALAGFFTREWGLLDRTHPVLGFFDVSPAYEAGFAYALFAYGGVYPSGPSESELANLILSGKNRANSAKLESLKLRLSVKK